MHVKYKVQLIKLVKMRPRNPIMEPPRNALSIFSKKLNISETIDNNTSIISTELTPTDLTTGFLVFIVSMFISATIFTTCVFRSDKVNPELIEQATENPVVDRGSTLLSIEDVTML